MKPRLEIRRGGIKMVPNKTRPWRDVALGVVSGLDSWDIVLSTVVCAICFAEPDTIFIFKVYFRVYGEGTYLAMPKTICEPDSSDSRTICVCRTVGL